MTLQELGTIREHDLPVKVLILNNGKLGMIRQWQNILFHQHYVASDLHKGPDFVKLANAYEIPGVRARSREDYSISISAIEKMLATPGPVVGDFQVDPDELVLPFVLPGGRPEEMLGRWQGETHLRSFSGK